MMHPRRDLPSPNSGYGVPECERHFETLQAEIQAGLNQAERGEALDGDEAFARVRAALAARGIALHHD